MTRAQLLANLIYLIVTYVQVSLFSSNLRAAPNLQDWTSSSSNSRTQQQNLEENLEGGKAETEASSSAMESLIIAEPSSTASSTPKKTMSSSFWSKLQTDRLLLHAGLYLGPYQEVSSSTLYTLGLNYRGMRDSSEWLHTGFMITTRSNPFIYGSHEFYLRNYWSFLKSWHYIIQLEIDTPQGLGSFFSWNHYMGGVGLSFILGNKTNFILQVSPLSSRGVSSELKLSYLFGN